MSSKTETAYAILTDITPNFGDVVHLTDDVDDLFYQLEEQPDDCQLYRVEADVEVGQRVRLATIGERVSLANL